MSSLFLISVLFFSSSFVAESTVPSANTFRFTNEGDFGNYVVEYKAYYRALPLFNSPFQLCFYNTTPNAFTLALRMGLVQSDSVLRWVWDANRRNPVGENATLTYGADGNLVLADADGRIAWQTGTANRGAVGQSLRPNGPNRIISRSSEVDGSEGPYSLLGSCNNETSNVRCIN
ncbi:hypothetical protein MKW94_020901 [Papaver nudicaule]|uniref:Bulb-type lectin domain-containing protein n=1 Tax=Papaver nudicaule TaxID=74823 RepID=A0AA42AVA7_PAPNU|nr:hypothetical protein [Papaver nudicaule]